MSGMCTSLTRLSPVEIHTSMTAGLGEGGLGTPRRNRQPAGNISAKGRQRCKGGVCRPGIAGLFAFFLLSAPGGGLYVLVVAIFYALVLSAVNLLISLAMARTQKALTPWCKVRRDGKLYYVRADGVVPGDLLYLTAGDYIPADALVTASQVLRVRFDVGEESIIMSKQTKPLAAARREAAALQALKYPCRRLLCDRWLGACDCRGLRQGHICRSERLACTKKARKAKSLKTGRT